MAEATATDAAVPLERRRRLELAAGIVIIVLTALVTLNGIYLPLGPPGIDPGWQWAMNTARDAGNAFGRDIVFTYGPLGFLMVPMDVASNLVVANTFLLGIQLLFAGVLMTLFLHDRRLLSVAAFAVLFVCARHQGLTVEAFLLLVVGLLTLLGVHAGRRLPVAVAGILAAVLFLVKMSLGVASLVILGAGLIVARFVFRRSSRFTLALLVFPLTLVILAAFFFDRPDTFFRWLHLSAEVISGYSVANSIIGPGVQVALGTIAVAVWFGSSVALRHDRPLFACNLVFAPVVLIQFRLAFVRQDTHQLQFVPFMLALIAVSALFARRPRQIGAHVAWFTALLFAASLTGLADPVGRGLLPANLLSGGSGPRALSQLLHIRATQEALATKSAVNLEPLRLGDDVRTLLEDSHNGVGTLPWEIQYCPANRLDWNPTPTLQLYTAYTGDLDLWSAEHYAGGDAPQFIINSFAAVGMRRQLFDTPATWRTVFINYELRSVWWKPETALLLERREDPPQWNFEEVARSTVVLEGASIPVPASNHLVFADINLRFNPLGRIQKTLFRVPMVVLLMTHQSHHISICRLIPGTAGNSVLINRFPRDFRGYRRLWAGVIDDPVVRLAVSGDGTSFFHPRAAVTWRELQIASPTPPSAPDPRQTTLAESSPAPPESP